jgi:hemerythrin-like domain-containing protein
MAKHPQAALLHPGPAASFAQPFEMLAGCHERVRRTLALLLRLHEHLGRHGPDAMARDAARDVLRYFDIAAPAHHEDEERHVFPQLQARGQAALVARLRTEHATLAALWHAARPALVGVHAGQWPAAGAAAAAQAWPALVAAYERHIACEDDEAFPAARAGLSDTALAAMGHEMAARRGVPDPGPAQAGPEAAG